MRLSAATAVFFAASIAAAVAYPARRYYGPVSFDEDEYPGGKDLWAGRSSYSLSSAPFYFQPRHLEVEDSSSSKGRKYSVVKKKKNSATPPAASNEEDDDEPQDEEDSGSEEDEEEEADDEQSFDIPPWEKLFPEEDKNTGNFKTPGDGYSNNNGGSLANIPGGAPAPESHGSLMNLFSAGGSWGGLGGGESQQGQHGGGGGPPTKYRQGRPPYHRARTSIPAVEEPRSGGAVLYDGYRYIPVKPVQVRIPQRQAKKVKVTPSGSKVGRSLNPTPRQNKKLVSKTRNKKDFVFVPVERDSRELRFSRDEHGFRVDSGPMYAPPTEIWKWEGPGGRPLRRRENRPTGMYYAPGPPRGSASTVRFSEDSDY